MMNTGLTGEEIAEEITFPDELEDFWPNRGYYGTVKHNSRAVYQRYLGWYTGNPADLDVLPPVAAAKKYVEYMGGEAEVLKRAKADYDKGEYRWAAMVLKHIVFANPDSVNGKNLLADAFEQMAYQAESGPWRSVYLQGANELRNGVPNVEAASAASPDTIAAMPPEMVFDYLSVRLNGPKAAGKDIRLNWTFSDLGKTYGLHVLNGVLNHREKPLPDPNATVTLTKQAMNEIQLGKVTIDQAVGNGSVRVSGNQGSVTEFFGLLDDFPFWFNIVTP
ncbi:alkyl sulfatase dimerization domain-containing protein [Gordonia crocea]|uniref:Uncharacterized protein n=1 Tax=Gordonia crocea TaxID=589162 RepID=A0A7I9UVS1_9ACTN|nr:alkyl sulfatase dimerization domain-containing protein [Gordonia crocea]GED97314.1 hypothetical protein nbrc107697_13530 [Gordonia crocea]